MDAIGISPISQYFGGATRFDKFLKYLINLSGLAMAGPARRSLWRASAMWLLEWRPGRNNAELRCGGELPVKAFLVGALIALSATAVEAANTKNKKTTSAVDAYARCLSETAAKLDDGKADPNTVAVSVAAQCAWKRELAIAEMTKGSNDPDAKQGAAEAVRGAETGIIIGTVLELRKKGMWASRQSGTRAAGKK
jgi:hypothetical protein